MSYAAHLCRQKSSFCTHLLTRALSEGSNPVKPIILCFLQSIDTASSIFGILMPERGSRQPVGPSLDVEASTEITPPQIHCLSCGCTSVCTVSSFGAWSILKFRWNQSRSCFEENAVGFLLRLMNLGLSSLTTAESASVPPWDRLERLGWLNQGAEENIRNVGVG